MREVLESSLSYCRDGYCKDSYCRASLVEIAFGEVMVEINL